MAYSPNYVGFQVLSLLGQSSHSFHDPFYSHELQQIMVRDHPSICHVPNASPLTDTCQMTEQDSPNTRRSRGCSVHSSAQSKGVRTKRPGGKKCKCSVESGNHENPTTDYIHVRARRGQATDSHSLAERVRREKISERMKTLQALVPGCNMVTGKAPMLDHIITYIQSLQNQVQSLSMKLASVSPIYNQKMEQPDDCNKHKSPTQPTIAVETSFYDDHHLESSNLLHQVQMLFSHDGSDGDLPWDVIDFNSFELGNILCDLD